MTRALILGSNGQDGTFLVRRLLKAGHEVVGCDMAPTPRFDFDDQKFSYVSIDLRGQVGLRELLRAKRPDLIFHVAAVHLSAGGRYEEIFPEMLPVNVESAHTVLEYLRCDRPDARMLYASSLKVFGAPAPSEISEISPVYNTCLYSITKNAVGGLVQVYRRDHGVKAGLVYLFNHESELRPPHFFIPKLAACVASAKAGGREKTEFYTLRFHCDWGSAEEYAGFMVDMLERAPGEDFVLATGTCTYAADFVQSLFDRHGLDASRHMVELQSAGSPPSTPYLADLAKLRTHLGRTPEVSVDALVDDLIERLGQHPMNSDGRDHP